MSSLREQILGARDIASERVTVREWDNAELELRGLSGTERAQVLKDSQDDKGEMDLGKFHPTILIASCYDPATGQKIFQPADRDALGGKSAGVTERLAAKVMRLSGLAEGEKKNGGVASGGSTSDSPKTSE